MRPRTNRDIFGRFSSGEFDIDRSNMQILQMIHAKYSREYLPFFAMLSTMYGSSKRGKEIREEVIWINQVRGIIEAAIFGGKVSGDQATELYDLFDKIEDRKQVFIDEVKQNQSLQQKMDKVQQTVGISTGDLNITKDMLKAGVKQAKKRDIGGDFRHKHPESSHRLRRIGEGIKVAALGPFSPVFDLVSDLSKMLASRLGRGENRRESRLMTSLGLHTMTGSGFQSPTPTMTPGANITPMSMPPTPPLAMDPLFQFFNNKAYKAKWTRELLDRMKKAGQASIDNGSLLRIGGGILKYTALIAGAVISIKQFVNLFGAAREAKEAGRKAVIAGTDLGKVIAQRDAEVQSIGLDAAAAKYKKTPQQVIKESAEREHIRQKTIDSGIKAQESTIARIGRLTPIGAAAKAVANKVYGNKPKVQSVEELQKQYERKFTVTPPKIDTKQLDEIVKGAIRKMEETSKSVDKLTERIGNQNDAKPVSVGNPFDSADPLVTQLSSGKLTIGGK